MDALEIQVLSGVHAGARYQLVRPSFRLAGDEHAELVLLDEGLEDAELNFQVTDRGDLSVMSRSDYEIFDQSGEPVRPATRWGLGQFLVISRVWLALGRVGDALMVKPDRREPELAIAFSAALNRPSKRPPVPLIENKSEDPDRAAARRARRVASIALGSIVAMVLVAGVGVALVAVSAENSLKGAAVADGLKPKAPSSEFSATEVAIEPPQEEMATLRVKTAKDALERMLGAAGLTSSVAVKWDGSVVDVRATINSRSVPQFEQLMLEFERDFGSCCKVLAKVVPPWSLLPFRIREVVTGPDGWIVTDAGERVLVGGTVGGYTLNRAGPDKVVLSGPRDVEIDL